MKKYICNWAILSLAVLAGCQERDLKIRMIIEPDFSGFIALEEDEHAAPLETSGDIITITIPEAGHVRIRDLSIFNEWHRSEYVFKGESKATSYEDKDDRFMLYDIGIGVDAARKKYQLYLLGSQEDYDWYLRAGRSLTLNELLHENKRFKGRHGAERSSSSQPS